MGRRGLKCGLRCTGLAGGFRSGGGGSGVRCQCADGMGVCMSTGDLGRGKVSYGCVRCNAERVWARAVEKRIFLQHDLRPPPPTRIEIRRQPVLVGYWCR